MHENNGESTSVGSVRNGRLINGHLIPYRGPNFRYFSLMSYYILNNAYVHSSVYQTIQESYATCRKTCPGITFRLMECSNRTGGKIPVHWTHQNGMSADFMVPKKRNGTPTGWLDWIGIWHYALEFDESGRSNLDKKTVIDWDSTAKHLLALDDAARQNGLRIRKVILKIELQDDLFAATAGKELRKRDVHFVRRLGKTINDLHDDHYHVDFEFL